MIVNDAAAAFEALAERLEARAAALAEAHARTSRLADDPARWRRPDLLWPTFGDRR